MKRYLQAGTIVFFLIVGIWLKDYYAAQKITPSSTSSQQTDATFVGNPITSNVPERGEDAIPPTLTVSSALMKTAAGERIFYELNTDQHWPLASLTKLMNAVIALEHIPPTKYRDLLIQRMMVISDNAAADTLADMLGREQYIQYMNEKAHALAMRQTGFSDPSGLSYLNQSTVKDIDKLVTYILIRHPHIFAWSRAKTVATANGERTNINEFALRPEFIGGKTGFTDEANGNLVTIFSTSSGPVTIITLGSPTQQDRFTETQTLFLWATQHFKL